MKKLNRCWVALAAAAMLVVPGCNSDDKIPTAPAPAPVVQAGLNSALQTTVVPLVSFFGALSQLLAPPAPMRAGAGFGCPDTTAWCAGGTVSCSVGATGLAFNFDQCVLATGDLPITLDGDIVAVPGTTIALTLTNLFVNNSPAMSGTGTIDPVGCDYTVDITTADATVSGLVTKCATDNYPTGDTLYISFGDFLVTIVFDGTNPAHATATLSGTPVASCTIDQAADPISSSCDPI